MEDPTSAAMRVLARAGGRARARNLTAEERRESARKAAQARWDKAEHPADRVISCTVAHERTPHISIDDHIEIEEQQQVLTRAVSHMVKNDCCCDQCIDQVIAKAKERYQDLLKSIDRGNVLTKDEKSLFYTLIGTKPNRWTRAFRQARKAIEKAK